MRGIAAKDFRTDWSNTEAFSKAVEQLPEASRRQALQHYYEDPSDTATPKGMWGFLVMLRTNRLLSQKSTQLLLQIMTESTTGLNLHKAGLPAGLRSHHKTG